jgi:hypothetical protein
MNSIHLPDFSSKVVYVQQIQRDHGVALENPSFEIHDERLFLVGTIPEGGSANDWLAGLVSYIAWDYIQEIVVFDSMEDYINRLSRGWIDERLQ